MDSTARTRRIARTSFVGIVSRFSRDGGLKSASTLKLFSNAAMNDHYTYGRLYGCKIYEEGDLVRDYAPICQGGTYALVDKVTGKTLAKASGSAAFNDSTANDSLDDSFFYAPMRDEDAYIESDGTQGINLGYFTTPQTRYEIGSTRIPGRI